MACGSGFDVAAMLKNDPTTESIPILILTIVADEETELRPQLVVDDERNLRWIPGAAVLAGGAVFFGLGIRSWRIVRGYDDERAFHFKREAHAPHKTQKRANTAPQVKIKTEHAPRSYSKNSLSAASRNWL